MTIQVSEIVVAAGERRSEVIRIDHQAGDRRTHALRVRLEPGGMLELQELHRGSGACDVRLQVELDIGTGGRMRHVAVVDDAGDGRFKINRKVRLAAQAELDYTRFGSGAASDCELLHTRMDGRRSRFRHNALMMVEAGRHAELDLEIAHHARNAKSDSLCRCVLGPNGKGRFAGKILIAPEGQGADARLRNDNLLLDESAHMETRPELEVYADEVQCAHGAATGALDEAALFYLRTRGMSTEQARSVLVRAFASRISEAIESAEAAEMARAMLTRALDNEAPRKLAA